MKKSASTSPQKPETLSVRKLESVSISSFKSLSALVVFPIENPLVVIGPNGAGKSSLIQALGFIRQFFEGHPQVYFETRRWKAEALASHYSSVLPQLSQHAFAVIARLLMDDDTQVKWLIVWDLNRGTSLAEVVSVTGNENEHFILEYISGDKYISGKIAFSSWKNNTISGLILRGSVLSAIDVSRHPDARHRAILQAIAKWAGGVTSLELLTPESMRRMARGQARDMGMRGELVGSFLASLSAEAKDRIVTRLARFYPALDTLRTARKKAGWIDLSIGERFNGHAKAVGSDHISDGFLRLLALAAIPELPKAASLVLLDEIENGIDPLILPDFIDMIVKESGVQIIMTTHSPLLVNRFPPESIYCMARSKEGPAVGASFAEIKEIEKELEFRGPGEIWLHSSLDTMANWVRKAHKHREKIPELTVPTKRK